MKTKFTSTMASVICQKKNFMPVLFWIMFTCYSANSHSQAGNTRYGINALVNNTGNSNTAIGAASMFANTNGGSYNTAIGYRSLYSNTTGWSNTVSGYHSMYNNTTGGYNTASGNYSLFSNISGFANTANGYASLYKNTSGNNNTAVGYWALYNNTTGLYNVAVGNYSLNFNTTGNNNTATGYQSLYSNTTGYHNTATGYQSLFSNTTGYWNTANGHQSLYSNTTGNSNTTYGYQAMYSNISGSFNTSFGLKSLYANTTGEYNTGIGYAALSTNNGSFNTALGRSALVYNTTGFYNAATGNAALAYNTTGYNNTANGYAALYTNKTGSQNTALGCWADVSVDNLTNATAIGYGAKATASNQIMLGNSAVTTVRTFGAIIWPSDGRFKTNMKENVPGLDFIRQLRPLTYHYDIHGLNNHISTKANAKNAEQNYEAKLDEEAINKKEKIVYSGFIAQEVEAAAKKLGYDFSGVYKPQNEKDIYGLSYSEFVVPLIKAVQELAKKADEKDAKIDSLQKQVEELKSIVLSRDSKNPPEINITKTALSSASLEQNIPNPFVGNTTINYTLPQKYATAFLTITDIDGKTIKQLNVSGAGKGRVELDTRTLSSGTYSYSLFIDGRLISSKQMILTK